MQPTMALMMMVTTTGLDSLRHKLLLLAIERQQHICDRIETNETTTVTMDVICVLQ